MKLSSTFTFSLPIIGKDFNKSHQQELTLYTKQLGNILLPYEYWDLSLINFSALDIYQVQLETCQGTLSLTLDIVTKEIYKEIIDGQIQFNCPGVWEGSCGGLLTGISGYGEYTFDKNNAYVSGSVYNLMSDFKGNFDLQWLYPSSSVRIWCIWYTTTYCTYQEYQLRVEAMEQNYGYYAVKTMAKEVRDILCQFEELRFENSSAIDNDCGLNLNPVIEWQKKIEDAVKAI